MLSQTTDRALKQCISITDKILCNGGKHLHKSCIQQHYSKGKRRDEPLIPFVHYLIYPLPLAGMESSLLRWIL
jgi:hypothetical protein